MTHVGLFAASPFGLIGSLVSFGWLGILFVYCLLLVFEVCACALVCVFEERTCAIFFILLLLFFYLFGCFGWLLLLSFSFFLKKKGRGMDVS